MTLALPKVGLVTEEAQAVVGELYLADISVPPTLHRELGIEPPLIFTRDTIVRVSEDTGILAS